MILAIIAYKFLETSFSPQITAPVPERQLLSPLTINVPEVTATMKVLFQQVSDALQTDNVQDSLADLKTEFEKITSAYSAFEKVTEDSTFQVGSVILMLKNPEKHKIELKKLAKKLNCKRSALPDIIVEKFGLYQSDVAELKKFNTEMYNRLYSKFGWMFLKYYPDKAMASLYKPFFIGELASNAFENYEDFNIEQQELKIEN